MRGPPGMGNPCVCHEFLVHVDILLIDQFAQCSDFADLLEEIDFILGVTVNGHTGGIIASVFETLETCNSKSARHDTAD
jgi:hypothetical protein